MGVSVSSFLVIKQALINRDKNESVDASEEVRKKREEREILIMNENNLKDSDIRGKIDIAFARFIGPLAIMNELKSYESSQEEIRNLLDVITK